MLVKNKKLELGKIFFIGIVTATIIFIPFIIFDKGLFLYYGDFNVQQIPFYELAHESIRNGNILWNWNTDLGANFIGSYSFYLLGSPFFWLTLPFPTEFVPYLMAPLLILKFGVTSVTSYALIRRFSKTSSYAMIGALIFTFSGFNVYNIFFNHFNEAVAFFPLILIALEENIMNKRKGVLVLAIAFNAITNYFFFFGQVIFTLLYFIARCFDEKFRSKIKFKKFINISFESILGLALSCILLLPSIAALSGNSRTTELLSGWNFLVYNSSQMYPAIFQSLFFPPDLPARLNFFPDTNVAWSSVSAFLPLFTVTGVFAFLMNIKKHWIKIVLITAFIMAMIPGLNSIFYGLNTAYYARWYYMPLLIMSLATVLALENKRISFKKPIILTGIIIITYSIIGIFPSWSETSPKKLEFGQLPPYPAIFWLWVTVAVLCLALTSIIIIKYRKNSKKFTKITIIAVCGISILYSTTLITIGKSYSYSRDAIVEDAMKMENILNEELPNWNENFYRIDVFNGMDNIPMYWKIPSIQAFHSVVPPSITDYYNSIGVERNVASRPEPQYYGIRGLTSVKYLMVETANIEKYSNAMPGFKEFKNINGFQIYENNYFIPMGFTYNNYIDVVDYDYTLKDDRHALLMKGIYLGENQSKYYDILQPLSKQEINNTSQDEYLNDCAERMRESSYEFKVNNQGFTSKINLSKDNLVFYSVPYDKGWKAYVNGAETEIINANIGFMAVKAPKGDNEIVFSYTTPGLYLGILITIISLLILIIYLIVSYILKKNNKNLSS